MSFLFREILIVMQRKNLRLINKTDSLLLIIDVQEKLVPFINNKDEILNKINSLIHLANEMDVPVILSEQYPKGLGSTDKTLKENLKNFEYICKTHFSCCENQNFNSILKKLDRKQIIIAGIESHVCVLQSAISLLLLGYEVFIVANAVSSRFKIDHKYALKRMQQFNIQLVTFEMVFFEWIHDSASNDFKRLSKTFLQGD